MTRREKGMNEFGIINLSRRDFLKAGAGLTLGIAVPDALAQNRLVAAGEAERVDAFAQWFGGM